MKRVGEVILAAVAFIAAAALIAWFFTRGDKAAVAMARADLTEKLAEPKIKAAQTRLDALAAKDTQDTAEIAKVEAELANKKEELRAKFERQGLSASEVAERFRRVRL